MPDTYLPCRWGPFLIEAEIRRGAPDITYRAVHEPTQQPIHLVVARSDSAFEEECARRAEAFEAALKAQAAALARVSHPALTRILDAGVFDSRPYLALSPLVGPTLGELTRGGPPLDPTVLCTGLADVADGYHALHEADILLGSANQTWITVTPEERFVVHDFALACPIYRATRLGRDPSEALGKPLYLSPEQLLPIGDGVDRRTDLYGLGATLYYGLTGQPPFKTENLHALMRMVLRRRPKPPHKVKRSVPRKLSRLVLRCLAKEQRDRPATAAELAAELRALFPDSPRKEARFGVG